MTGLKKKHTGLNPHRLSTNPLEKKFSLEWQRQQELYGDGRADTLDYLLHTGDQRFPIPCSERDRQVANTVIQWLGSPVGEAFVRKVLGEAE